MRRLTDRYLPVSALVAACITLSSVAQASAPATPDKALSNCPVAAYTMGLRYQQQSAEIRALQRQSWALATYRLKDILSEPQEGKPLAIITDLDETVIDNSALLVRDLKACHDELGYLGRLGEGRRADPDSGGQGVSGLCQRS